MSPLTRLKSGVVRRLIVATIVGTGSIGMACAPRPVATSGDLSDRDRDERDVMLTLLPRGDAVGIVGVIDSTVPPCQLNDRALRCHLAAGIDTAFLAANIARVATPEMLVPLFGIVGDFVSSNGQQRSLNPWLSAAPPYRLIMTDRQCGGLCGGGSLVLFRRDSTSWTRVGVVGPQWAY